MSIIFRQISLILFSQKIIFLFTARAIRVKINKGNQLMKDKDLLKLLKRNGWKLKRTNGSHHVLEKDGNIEIIPIHGRDVPTGLLNAILKRTKLK